MANYNIDEMKTFMMKHKEDIEKNNFDALYNDVFSANASNITEFLLEAGVDPLAYMTYVPTSYAEDIESIQSVTLPPTIKSINGWAFNGCRNLIKVDLNEGLEQIGQYAFRLCNIKEIKLPSTVIYLNDGAFQGCVSLSEIDLSNIKEIRSSVFYDTQIETLYLPKTLNWLSSGAFKGMKRLKEIVFEGTQEDWDLLIPSNKSWYSFLCDLTLKKPNLKILG